jgi:hypothetical protein
MQIRSTRGSPASIFVRTLVAHEPRHHVYSVRLSFLPQLRDKCLRDAFRQQRLERGEFGAFPSPPIAARCRS